MGTPTPEGSPKEGKARPAHSNFLGVVIQRIVDTWPVKFQPSRGLKLGFEADPSIERIIQDFVDDELGGLSA